MDAAHGIELAGGNAELVWHRETTLAGFDAVVLPGGFAHGDYLRTGAIARFSAIMSEVQVMADAGAPVLGICNGFQILCEAGMLPGALVANRDLKFICRPVHMRVEQTTSVLTTGAEAGQVLEIPLNSYEGNYIAPSDELAEIETNGQVVLRYCDGEGKVGEGTNPNGSTNSIAGVSNASGNVVGLMPHPERASEEILGSADGLPLLSSFVDAATTGSRVSPLTSHIS
jgi:phosphoribosylformylglycinamidine synthase